MIARSALIAAALVLGTPAMSSVASAQSAAYAESGVTNLRSGPSTAYTVVGKVYGGTPVQILDSQGGWYYVSVNGQRGWMAGSRLEFTYARAPATVIVPEPYYPRYTYPYRYGYTYPYRYGGPSISFSFGNFDRDRDRRHHRRSGDRDSYSWNDRNHEDNWSSGDRSRKRWWED